MIAKMVSFFYVLATVMQMLIGGYPVFNADNYTADISDFSVTANAEDGFFTYAVQNPDVTRFNRFSLNYSSGSYMRGVIFYTYKCRQYSEEFFIEPGTDMTYSSLIDGYLEYGSGKKISRITFEAISGEGHEFLLESVHTSVAQVHKDVVYIENSRYRLGASLLWGGAVSYLEDLKDSDESLTNLVNCHDTGRLIQQSYYGTNSAPYEPGISFNVTWSYNPVQGGNQYGQNSKIIDLEINDDSMYIKARARDWAKKEYTYCIMENTYTLSDDYIKVDNRFIDYSPYVHPYNQQECPALYTVSSLGTFVYYDGAQDWTGGALTYRDDLGFWGDPDEPQVRKTFGSYGAESWSAWVNSGDWGLGVYTPGAKQLAAGRYGYNGTKNASEDATNYVANIGQFSIVRCKPTEYSYFLSTGTAGELRTLFSSIKDLVYNELFD